MYKINLNLRALLKMHFFPDLDFGFLRRPTSFIHEVVSVSSVLKSSFIPCKLRFSARCFLDLRKKSLFLEVPLKRIITFFTVTLLFSVSVFAEKDPTLFFYSKGKLVGDWHFKLGDEKNWAYKIDGLTGISTGGKVEVMPDSFQEEGDAIRAVWHSKPIRGGLRLVASSKDLSALKNIAAVALQMKVNSKIKGKVRLSIDCGYPCRGGVDITRQLKKKPRNKWIVFPVPLNCFNEEHLDLSKVRSFMVSTPDELDLSIHDVSLMRLPEGTKGCAK